MTNTAARTAERLEVLEALNAVTRIDLMMNLKTPSLQTPLTQTTSAPQNRVAHTEPGIALQINIAIPNGPRAVSDRAINVKTKRRRNTNHSLKLRAKDTDDKTRDNARDSQRETQQNQDHEKVDDRRTKQPDKQPDNREQRHAPNSSGAKPTYSAAR